MEAGRELDAEVARRVFGHDADPTSRSWQDGYGCEGTFYSTDIAAAWEVATKMREQWPDFAVVSLTNDAGVLVWSVSWGFDGHGWDWGEADTAPLAICRAALKAMEARDDNP